MSPIENCENGQQDQREMTFKEICEDLRKQIGAEGIELLNLRLHKVFKVFDSQENYVGQHGEMKANIMLAYRHLEDARMRIGKILQAAGDGISILDKPPFKEPKR